MYRFRFIVNDVNNDNIRFQKKIDGLIHTVDCALVSLQVVHSPELFLKGPEWHSLYHALSDQEEQKLFKRGTTTEELLDILKMREIDAVLDNAELKRKRP